MNLGFERCFSLTACVSSVVMAFKRRIEALKIKKTSRNLI